MPLSLTRRGALKLGTAGTLGYLFTGPSVSVRRAYGANEKIRVAGIGIGGKGASDIEQAAKVMDVVALCDIDDQRLNAAGAKWPSAKKYFDYRTLFDAAAKEFDAVTVSTADHSHTPASVLAMRLGKHVYCQKPLTHTVWEARLMRAVAAEKKVCTQMGNQGSALSGLRRAVELIHAGTLGAIREAHVWTNRPAHYWKQSPDIVSRPKEAPVPKHVHWDEFIGPAPMRPFAMTSPTRGAYHPHDWRGYWDFGTGALRHGVPHREHGVPRDEARRAVVGGGGRGRDQRGDVPGVGAHPVPFRRPRRTARLHAPLVRGQAGREARSPARSLTRETPEEGRKARRQRLDSGGR